MNHRAPHCPGRCRSLTRKLATIIRTLLCIQPVYLQEEGPLKIPQLKRLIMAIDDAVVMAPSLEEAAVKLQAELERKTSRMDRRFPTEPPAESPKTPPKDDAEIKPEPKTVGGTPADRTEKPAETDKGDGPIPSKTNTKEDTNND